MVCIELWEGIVRVGCEATLSYVVEVTTMASNFTRCLPWRAVKVEYRDQKVL